MTCRLTRLTGGAVVAASLVGFGSAASAAIIPVTAFTPVNNGGGGNIFASAVDEQPATDPVAGEQYPDADSTFSFFGSSPRQAGLDFGADFAAVTIHQAFIAQGTFGNPTANIDYYWSSDTTLDGLDPAAPDFNLFTYSGASNSSIGTWTLTYDNPAGVTPLGRYLIVRHNSGEGNFKYELAFVNVPEPASLALLGLGAAMMAGRRRR